MSLLDRLRRRNELTADERAEFEQWSDNRARLIATDADAARLLTIDPCTVRTTRDQAAFGDQIRAYVTVKLDKGEPYDQLWSTS